MNNKQSDEIDNNPLLSKRHDSLFTPNISPAPTNRIFPRILSIRTEAIEINSDDMEEEVLEMPQSWAQFGKYTPYGLSWESEERSMSQIFAVNKIIKYFYNEVVVKKTPFREVKTPLDFLNPEVMSTLVCFEKYQSYYARLKEGRLSWRDESQETLSELEEMTLSHTEFYHAIDCQYINTSLFQLLFPVDLIDMFVSLVYRDYEDKEKFQKVVHIQTGLMEVFLWHHFKSDFAFYPILTTTNLGIVDPFLRNLIRSRVYDDKKLMRKYFNSEFNLKKFAFKLLDLYFPMVTVRCILYEHKMHLWTLQLILMMFKLGLWEHKELDGLVTVLIQKLENLSILELACYKDFPTLSDTVQQHELKDYFVKCREKAVSICIHIVVLINDTCIVNNSHLFNNSKKLNHRDSERLWKDAHFNNSDLSEKMMRLLTSFIMKTKVHDVQVQFTAATLHNITDLFKIMTDVEHDMFYVSSKVVTDSTLDFYSKPIQTSLDKLANDQTKTFISLLAKMASTFTDKVRLAIQNKIANQLEALEAQMASHGQSFKYVLSLHGLPKVLLSIFSMVASLNSCDRCQDKCSEVMGLLLRNNPLGQAIMFDDAGVKHFKILFDTKPFSAMILIESIFSDNFNLFYVQRSLCEQFFGFFRALEDKLMYNFKTTSIEWRGDYQPDEGQEEPKDEQKEDFTYFYFFSNLFQSAEGKISGRSWSVYRGEACDFSGGMGEDGKFTVKMAYKNGDYIHAGKLSSTGRFEGKWSNDTGRTGLFKFQTNMKLHAANHDDKLKQLITSTVHSKDTSKFELLLAYFMFCRWLTDLIVQRDANLDAKFMELSLQEIIESSIFNCMVKIISTKHFLPKTAAGGIDFEPQLLNSSVSDMQRVWSKFDKRCKAGGLSNIEANGIMFEVAMTTLNLMNKACSRLYLHRVYTKASAQLKNILEDTEYMFGMTNGLEYRTAVLELYTLFYVFPNNHLVAGRQQEFTSDGESTSEVCIPKSHLAVEGGTSKVIVKEIERIASKCADLAGIDSEKGKHYLFKGLFPMIYKYLRGVLAYYVKDQSIGDVKRIIDSIQTTFEQDSSAINLLFNVNLAFESELVGVGIESPPMVKRSSVDLNSKHLARDWNEIQFPELHLIRNKIIGICDKIKTAYLEDANLATKKLFENLEGKTNVPTALTKRSYFDTSLALRKFKQFDSHSTMPIEDSKSGEEGHSLDIERFRLLMEEYKTSKKAMLIKPNHQDSLIQFLESDAANAEVIVSFYTFITGFYFKRSLIEPRKDKEGNDMLVEPDGIEKAADRYMMTYLQSDVFYSFVRFLDMILNDCVMLKEALYRSCQDSEKGGEVFVMIMNFVMLNLAYLTIYKTFHDSDHRLLGERLGTLCSFFKNLCEDNYQNFKRYFGETKPQLPNVQDYFLKERSVVLDNGTRMMDIFLNNFNAESTRTSNVLTLADPVQNYSNLQHLIRWVTECLCGPCKDNQMQLYARTHVVFENSIERVVDNVNSNLYELKNTILDYFIALTEDNPTVVTYFAAFITFDVIFNLICTLLKRLYIYATVSQNLKNYSSLVMQAKKKYTDKKNESKKLKDEEKSSPKISFYRNSKYQKSSTFTRETQYGVNISEDDLISFETDNPSIITKEMEDCIKVDHFDDIMKVYLRKEVFSEHILMQVVLKLNNMLMNFSKQPGAHTYNLDNLYQALISKYTDEVPMYIRKRFTGVEMNGTKAYDEKHVFYMFLTKITAEIEVSNPEKQGEKVKTLYQLKPCTFFLTDHTKTDFETDIKQDEMINTLIEQYDTFEIEMVDNLKLFRRFPKLYKLSSDDSFWYFKLILWILGFALNVLMLIFYRRDAEPHHLLFVTAKHFVEEGQYPILILDIIIFGLSLTSLIVWLIARYRQKARIIALEYHKKEVMPLFVRNRFLRFLVVYIWEPFHSQSYPIVFSFHILSCLLGILVSPFFLTLQLLCIVSLSKTTNYVVQAITTHFDQMALSFFLAALVIYSYSVLTSEHFFYTLESNTPDETVNCRFLWECLMYHINHGLRYGGGIAEMTKAANSSEGTGRYISKFFYDMVFFILINVVALNIIFGIIIDTFTHMREDYAERGKH